MSGYVALHPLACLAGEEFVNILKPKSPVMAVAYAVGLEQPVITPRSDRVGMYVEKISYLRDR